jgi:hypothetical protein
MNRKEITVLSIITFLTVIAWIIFSVYHTKTSTGLEGIKQLDLKPLTPRFDSDIIRSLKNRED